MGFVLALISLLIFVSTIPMLTASAVSNTITLEIYSYYKSGDGNGHAWIVVTNDTTHTYSLGYYSMTPGETVTVGLWSSIGETGNNGVWYNSESYAISELGLWDGRVSLSMTITTSQLSKISDYIAKHDYWNASYNCSCFAKDIWNMVSDDDVNCGWMVNLPAWLCDSIRGKSSYYTNKSIETNEKIGYIHENKFWRAIPDLDGSSSSGSSGSSSSTNLMADGVSEGYAAMSLRQNIIEQLAYIGSDLTYDEYVQMSGLNVSE